MLDQDSGRVREIAWLDIFPGVLLLRTVPIALQFRLLVFGAVAAMLMLSGWTLLAKSPMGNVAREAHIDLYDGCPWETFTDPRDPPLAALIEPREGTLLVSRVPLVMCAQQPDKGPKYVILPDRPLISTWLQILSPLQVPLFRAPGGELSWGVLGYFLVASFWTFAVWALFGTAICRAAATQLALGEKSATPVIARYGLRHWISAFVGPYLPLAAVVFCSLPTLVLARFCIWTDSSFLWTVVWPFAYLLAFFAVLFLLGFLAGWPLMVAATACDKSDCFEAVSRAFSYVYQRPLHFVLYLLFAAALGYLGSLVVATVAHLVIQATYGTVLLGADSSVAPLFGEPQGTIARWCRGSVLALAQGFFYSYFWVAVTAIYLLMRRHVDGQELDEIHQDDPAADPIRLPSVTNDPAGAPVPSDD